MSTNETTRLPQAVQNFVLHWGDMGTQWGVNRSVAQIHALLYLSERPMHAEEISEQLAIARSNVSNSLKELLAWRLIERVPIAGDRRDHFAAVTDVLTMVTRIVEGRKQREIDPAIRAISSSIDAARSDGSISPQVLERLENLSTFMETSNKFYEDMLKVPPRKLMALMKMGAGIIKVLPGMR